MRFIGSKERLLPFIENASVKEGVVGKTFCDLFSGTASVAKHFKRGGLKIISNDFLYFSYVLQYAYIKVNKYPNFEKLLKHLNIEVETDTLFSNNRDPLRTVVGYLNSREGKKGFIYHNYSYEGTKGKRDVRKFFTGENAMKIDVIRQTVENWREKKLIDKDEYFLLLASLIEAVPFVSNISGTYAAFLKGWDKRAFKKLTLEAPMVIESNKSHMVYNEDAFDLIKKIKPDILYLDPPYNTRQYAPNYHLLETVAKWDSPAIKGVSGLRPYKTQHSRFSSKTEVVKALKEIMENAKFKFLLLSYNSEGLLSEEQIKGILGKRGKVKVFGYKYPRYKSNTRVAAPRDVIENLYIVKEVDPRNLLNDLSGSEWVYFLNSIEETLYPTSGPESYAHEIRKENPSPKPPQLMKKLVEFFTKESGRVLDPFVGTGSTLIACSLANRQGVGIDISKRYVNLYKHACKELGLRQQKAITGDSRNIRKLLKRPKERFDLILTDPPYGEMQAKSKTGEKNKKGESAPTPFTKLKGDLGNLTRQEFLESLKLIISESLYFLKPKGYLIIFAKDFQPTKQSPNLLHAEVVDKLLEIAELKFMGYKIWYDKTQKLYPFGYPYAFVANQFHQFILIFRKEK